MGTVRLTLFYVFLVMVLAGGSVAGCSRQDIQNVSLQKKTVLQQHSSANKRRMLRIGLGAMITPKEGFKYYHLLSHYLEKKTGMSIQLVDRDNYDQINKMLQHGELDAAFVCSGPYVEGKEKFGLELLAVPKAYGKTVYHSYIIVPKGSEAQNLRDLRGKTFAFTDPKSNTGKIVPTYMLGKINETPETFFKKSIYTYGHDKSIRAVAEMLVDGAAVDSLIWDYTAQKSPPLAARTRIIIRSPPYGIPPFVVRAAVNPEVKQQLQKALMGMSADPEGKEILACMMLEGFVPGNDRLYDSIREMNAWLDSRKRRN
jgi:phosphonate transport system substrate-binding protein